MRRTPDERTALARWLVRNAYRLARPEAPRTPAQMRHATAAENRWYRARSSLWTAAATLRSSEGV